MTNPGSKESVFKPLNQNSLFISAAHFSQIHWFLIHQIPSIGIQYYKMGHTTLPSFSRPKGRGPIASLFKILPSTCEDESGLIQETKHEEVDGTEGFSPVQLLECSSACPWATQSP